jgi:hypothetical protein
MNVFVGAAIPFAFALIVYLLRRGRLSLPWLVIVPTLVAGGAFWASVPDIPRILGYHGLYLRLMNDPRMDFFFWHHTIDAMEVDSSLYLAACVLMVALLFAACWRELSLRERGL